jgi:UDP-glucose 4-epimerase
MHAHRPDRPESGARVKILLTGGAGYVGSACLRHLLRHGHDPIAFDDLSEGNRAAVPEGRLIVGDIADAEALDRAFGEHRIEAVMHFAALASVPESIASPERYWRVNVMGTKSVLDAMRRHGVRRIVFSSTAATYGPANDAPLTEESAQQPTTPYGTTKLACEWMIREYAHAYELGYTHLRYFNASGADEDGAHGEDRRIESHLIPLTLATATGKQARLRIFGQEWPTRDGTCVRDYVHVDDLAQAHRLAVETLEPGVGRAYCLGSGTGTTVLEVVQACERVVGRPIPCEMADARPGDPAVLVAVPDRIVRELGWAPRFGQIDDIVRTAWQWHSSFPNGYRSKPVGSAV